MTLYTIGFTQKPAETFFGKLADAGVRRVIDVRLHNRSQLTGFAKRDDLEYFLRAIAGIQYVHVPLLAPEPGMLERYKKQGGSWEEYAQEFLDLMRERKIETELASALFESACLLCSEHYPAQCHRRLVAEYLQQKWGNVEIEHLV